MIVESITGSSGNGPNSVVQNLDRREYWKHSLMSPSSRLDSKIEQDKVDESRDIENFEDGEFPALRPNYDRRAHVHYTLLDFQV